MVGGGGVGSSVVLGRAAAEEKLRLGDGVGRREVGGEVNEGGLEMLIGGVAPGFAGVVEVGNGGTGGGADADGGDTAAALTARDGGPLGGGGFGLFVSAVAAPAFLLTHFFKSES